MRLPEPALHTDVGIHLWLTHGIHEDISRRRYVLLHDIDKENTSVSGLRIHLPQTRPDMRKGLKATRFFCILDFSVYRRKSAE